MKSSAIKHHVNLCVKADELLTFRGKLLS